MSESDSGWEIRVNRLEIQHYQDKTRTYGSYAVYLDGAAVEALQGFVCESHGMGDNSAAGVAAHSRIAAGTYGLATHFGDHYVSIDYAPDDVLGTHPMPCVLVSGTGHRSAILIHPGHPPTLFLSSIGCFNLTGPLAAGQMMDFTDSRTRVIAMIDSLTQFRPHAFDTKEPTAIAGARLVVIGEPA